MRLRLEKRSCLRQTRALRYTLFTISHTCAALSEFSFSLFFSLYLPFSSSLSSFFCFLLRVRLPLFISFRDLFFLSSSILSLSFSLHVWPFLFISVSLFYFLYHVTHALFLCLHHTYPCTLTVSCIFSDEALYRTPSWKREAAERRRRRLEEARVNALPSAQPGEAAATGPTPPIVRLTGEPLCYVCSGDTSRSYIRSETQPEIERK